MIITLNQSEIEAALTAHINNLMNLKDGVAIKYEFKATRGDEGFTAVLDITDGKAAMAPAPVKVVAAHPAATAKATVSTPKAETPKVEVKEETKPPFTPDTPKGNEETSSKHEEVKQEAAQSSDSQAASTEAAETGTVQAASAEAAPETAAAPAAAKPSLFANLKSPK